MVNAFAAKPHFLHFGLFLFLINSSPSTYLYCTSLFCVVCPLPAHSFLLSPSHFLSLEYSTFHPHWLTPDSLLCPHSCHPLSEYLFTPAVSEQVEDRMHYELLAGRQRSTQYPLHCDEHGRLLLVLLKHAQRRQHGEERGDAAEKLRGRSFAKLGVRSSGEEAYLLNIQANEMAAEMSPCSCVFMPASALIQAFVFTLQRFNNSTLSAYFCFCLCALHAEAYVCAYLCVLEGKTGSWV